LKSNVARPKGNHEAFIGGTMADDKLVLGFRSQTRAQVSPRKWKTTVHTRLVTCERRFTPDGGDFYWAFTGQRKFSYDLS
jgi:hypothetical protein